MLFRSEAKLAKEANRFGLVKGWKICDKKLKHTTGKDICPNCFIELLKRAPATNFTTIMNSFNITAEQMVRLIKTYLEEERIYGIIDSKNRMFYYISYEMRDKLVEKIQKEGIIKISDLGLMLDMNSEMALNVMYKLISKFQIKGSFSQDKSKYYTQKYITDNLIKTIIMNY